VVVTNTYPVDPSAADIGVKVLSVAPMFAEAIMRIHKDLSISVMFS
jgi:ribose-phosphate pyrophosphokinase